MFGGTLITHNNKPIVSASPQIFYVSSAENLQAKITLLTFEATFFFSSAPHVTRWSTDRKKQPVLFC